MSKGWWENVPSLVTSFLWSNEDEETETKMSETDKENQEPLKPNKSTLYTLLGNSKSEEPKKEKQEEEEEKPAEEAETRVEGEKKVEKNISSLYKIISSQNIVLKKPEEIQEIEGTEYQEIIENQHFETDNRLSIAENALYYVEEDETKKVDSSEEEMSKTKKSSIEIAIKTPFASRTKRSQSIIESPETESFFSIRKSHSTDNKSDLGDLSSISFSFFDDKLEDKSKDLVYDTIDESKVSLDLSSREYVPMKDLENPYSSPRNSINSRSVSREMSPQSDYVGPDPEPTASKDKPEEELFYAASEIINRRPPTPYGKRRKETIRESDYEDLDLESQELPDLPNPETDDYADVDVNDYCRHREENPKKLVLNHKTKNVNLVKVRSKINRAWKSVKSWMNEEGVLPKKPEVAEKVEETRADVAESPEGPSSPVAEDVEFTEADRRDGTMSDSETYMDMTPALPADSASDIFSTFTLLRRRKDGTTAVTGFRKSRHFPEGQNGFEELRRYIKQGGDFCKELSVILQERSEAETQYAKSLGKLSNKLLKTSKDAVGSVSEAWQRLGAEMEAQSDVHRAFAAALSEEVVKPLRQLVDSQHRIRKNVEVLVDKTGKTLGEWRQAEGKSKKQSFLCARENEKLQDAMLDVRNNRNASTLHLHHHNQKNLSDKESAKLDCKRKKAEESVKKADVEYYSFCVRAERSRLEWESAVMRGSHCFQALEEERLSSLKNLASTYLRHMREIGPKLIQSCDRLAEPVESCDVSRDIQTVVTMKGSSQPSQEQLLPDFYAEHVTLAMNRERRRQALVKLLQLIRQDLERERRGKQGVENLQRALQQTPNFGAEESQQNVDEKLHHMKSMLIYLEAARYKVQSALAELDGRSKPSHPLAAHIQVTRDRQGLQQSILKVPQWARNEAIGTQSHPESPDWSGREAGDGTSVQPDSDFDEFSSVGSDKDYQSSVYNMPIISECAPDNCTEQPPLGQCRALYEYSAKLYDELNLQIGDVIQIHDKQPDGWWLGELHGVIGIFPATYVEEIK